MKSEHPGYTTYIGLEIHIQLLTRSKAFCGCEVRFAAEPNTQVCPVCLGYPGVLPALNEEAVLAAYRVATALQCRLSPEAIFERKNYFYPDMPKNYQISQYRHPLGTAGLLEFPFGEGTRRVRIHDVHQEEDAGKMIHAGDMTLLDYNRAGTPLLEIVTEPDLRSGDEAEAFIHYFRRMVRYLGVCDGNMEEGSLRCDANVSVAPEGSGLGTKVEIKNLNSSRFVRLALDYEAERHRRLLQEGERPTQETRLWNEHKDVTVSMRSKEEAQDYRYFPEPDLPPFRPDDAFLQKVRGGMVELPLERQQRLERDCALEREQAAYICEERERADFFEETLACGAEPEAAALWLSGDVAGKLKRNGLSLRQSALTPRRLAGILRLLAAGDIHGKIAKKLLSAVFAEDKEPEDLVEEKGWRQIGGEEELRQLVERVVAEEEEAVRQLRAGEEKIYGYLMGRVMQASGGRAEPQKARRLLAKVVAELSGGE
jgi:aspartyl-tRNA(Asn)/glutamyl-tRNA(Gln) amidotransferase subunit B